jgi:hypothetical protein
MTTEMEKVKALVEQQLINDIGNAIIEALIKADFECSYMTDAQRDAMVRAALAALSNYARQLNDDDRGSGNTNL